MDALFARQDRLSPRDLEDPRVNPAGTAGWNTWNVRVGWEFAEDATLALSLENLDDRRYREHGSGTDEVGHTAILTLDWRSKLPFPSPACGRGLG